MMNGDVLDLSGYYGGPHAHCFSCHSFVLCPKTATTKSFTEDNDWCDFTTCPKCGWVYHGCKAEEHVLLCERETVKCINAGLGCPFKVFRGEMSNHLKSCPANVVVCSAEWNRAPVVSAERQRNIPFRQSNPRGKKGQLDFDFLMRDQRTVESLRQLSRKTRVVLRNSLTKRFPALPLPVEVRDSSQQAEKISWYEKSRIPLIDETRDDITYIGGQGQMTKQMKIWQQDLDDRLSRHNCKKIIKYWEFPELEKGNIHKHCSNCFDIDCQRTSEEISDDYDDTSCALTSCKWKCGQIYHRCKASEHFMICPLYIEPDPFDWMYRGVKGHMENMAMAKKKKKDKSASSKPSWPSIGDFGVGPVSPTKNVRQLVRKPKVVIPPPPPPPVGDLGDKSFLNIWMDTINRQHSKHKSMYTFVCGQQFRRDEHEWHSKNVHDDIMGNLDNWLEHRCPLASLGCGFSVRRMFPASESKSVGKTLFFSPAVESFGLRPVLNSASKSTPSKSHRGLMDMPTEILFEIIHLLDSFSICNLSLTCTYLRHICSVMLDQKGCVTPRWEKVTLDDGYGGKRSGWKVAYNQWFFSTAMDPVPKWSFKNDQCVSEHLKSCPYNVKLTHTHVDSSEKLKYDKALKDMKAKFAKKRSSLRT